MSENQNRYLLRWLDYYDESIIQNKRRVEINDRKRSIFLDRGLIGFLKHIDCLSVLTNRDIYLYIKNEIENNSQLQGMKFCREKTFYEWLRIGKIHAFNNIDSKKPSFVKKRTG